MKRAPGFAWIPVLFIVVAGIVLGGGIYWYQSLLSQQPVSLPAAYQGGSTTSATNTAHTTITQTQKIGPYVVFDSSSLVSTSTTVKISGTCSDVESSMAIAIVSGNVTLPPQMLPGISSTDTQNQTVFEDTTDHGGNLDANCSSGAVSQLPIGTFSTHYNNPYLAPGIYTVGIYTYQNNYTSQGYQGESGMRLLASATLSVQGNLSTSSQTSASTTLDDYIQKDSTQVYVKTYNYDSNGNELITYAPIAGADPFTFHAISGLVAGYPSCKDSGFAYKFYADVQHVYGLQDVEGISGSEDTISVINDADVKTFKVLDGVYALDAKAVYVIGPTWDGVTMRIPGADPSTFSVTFDPITLQDCSNGPAYDAKDGSHFYKNGEIID